MNPDPAGNKKKICRCPSRSTPGHNRGQFSKIITVFRLNILKAFLVALSVADTRFGEDHVSGELFDLYF